MSNTSIPCTVVTAVGGRCGKPAVTTFTTSRGETFAECAEHDASAVVDRIVAAAPAPEPVVEHPATRSTRPYLLVRDGEIVGYAESSSDAVVRRADKLGARVVRNRGAR